MGEDVAISDDGETATHVGHRGDGGQHVGVAGAGDDDVVGVVRDRAGNGAPLNPNPRTYPTPTRPVA